MTRRHVCACGCDAVGENARVLCEELQREARHLHAAAHSSPLSFSQLCRYFRYAPQIRTFGTDPRFREGSIAIAGGGAKTDWTLSLENNNPVRGDEGPEFVFDGEGNLIDTREEQRNTTSDQPRLSGSFTRIADNGNVLNLTGEVGGNIRREKEISERSGLIDPVD